MEDDSRCFECGIAGLRSAVGRVREYKISVEYCNRGGQAFHSVWDVAAIGETSSGAHRFYQVSREAGCITMRPPPRP
ncbi:hypothetical protein MRX96_003820 [Rhipicephalus microplus]